MSLKEPTLRSSHSLCLPRVIPLDSDIIAVCTGNSIVLLSLFSRGIRPSVSPAPISLAFEDGTSLDAFDGTYTTRLLVCAVSGVGGKRVMMYVLPGTQLVGVLEDKEKEEDKEGKYEQVAVSRNGSRVVTVSKGTNGKVEYWDVRKRLKLMEINVEDDEIQFLSFNPRSRYQFVLGNQKSVTIYTIESKFENYSFTKCIYFLDAEPPREILSHCWTADNRVLCGSQLGEILFTNHATKTLQVLNTSSILDCPIYFMVLTKTHLIVAADTGSLYWFSLQTFELNYIKDTEGKGLYAGSFLPNYHSIIAADLGGALYQITFAGDNENLTDENRVNDNWVTLTQLYHLPLSVNIFSRKPVSVGLATSLVSTKFITNGKDGSLALWDYQTGECLISSFFQSPITSVSFNPDDILAAVGFENGSVGILDLSSGSKFKLIYLERLHAGAVISLKFGISGKILATVGKDNRLFLLRVSDFTLLGFKDIPFSILSLQWLVFAEQDRLFITSNHGQGAILTPPSPTYVPLPSLLFEDNLKCAIIEMGIACVAVVPDAQQEKLIFGLALDKKLKRFEWNPKGTIELKSQYDSHSKFGKAMALSADNRLLATGGADGSIIIRRTDNLFALVKICPHNFVQGGVNSVCFSADSRYLLSAGADGGLFCWNLNIPARRDNLNINHVHSIVSPALLAELRVINENELSAITFDEKRKQQADLFFSQESQEKQTLLKEEVTALKVLFRDLLTENETVPEFEKLPREAFVVDEKEVLRITEEGNKAAHQIYEEIKYENMGKEIVMQRIKQQCWDTMEVKGSHLASFRSQLLVPNFPIRLITPSERSVLDKIMLNRKLEVLEQIAAKNQGISIFEFGKELTHGIDYVLNAANHGVEETGKTFTSSLDYLYHPADCITNQRKRVQIVLLKLRIDEIKHAFNTKFRQFIELKQSEMYRLEEKADRLQEIFAELHVEDAVFRPQWTLDELPEKVFVVEDSEITAEKVLSREEREKLELEEKDRQERLRRQAEDDSKDRALMDMMGGKLITNKDANILRTEMVREDWMKLPPAELTDEQKSTLADFEKKEKIFIQEKENLRKLLETECKKLKNEVNDICRIFDDKVQSLFDERIEVQKSICLQELTISKYVNDLVEGEEFEREDFALTKREKELVAEKSKAIDFLSEFRKKLSFHFKKCEQLLKEDKEFDKQVRKELIELAPDLAEALFRFYKSKRTKKAALVGTVDSALKSAEKIVPRKKSGNFNIKNLQGTVNSISSSKADASKDDEVEFEMFASDPKHANSAVEVDNSLDENDKPEELPVEIWIRVGQLRAIKYEKEVELKTAQSTLDDMKTYELNLITNEKTISDEISSTMNRKAAIKEQRVLQQLNSELFFLIKQGQVEIEEAPVVTDVSSAVMIHRSIVEELDRVIVSLGTEKVSQLKEISSIRAAISQLKWQQQILDIEHEEYVDRTTDFQLLRVTKDLQELIKVGGYDEKIKNEIINFEKKIDHLIKTTEDRIKDKQFKIDAVEKKIKHHEDENAALSATIAELSHAVSERENIWKIRQKDESGEVAAQKKRVRAIIERRRLLDLSKAQQDEIQFLKTELAKCRQRTFPSFQQLLPLPIATNPDVKFSK